MYRGTTPTLTFTPDISLEGVTACSIAFSQNNALVLEKKLDDCSIKDGVITCDLTEEETLLFDCTKRLLEIQIRLGYGDKRIASDIIKTSVDRILKDGCLE